jgi:hypothetical protein
MVVNHLYAAPQDSTFSGSPAPSGSDITSGSPAVAQPETIDALLSDVISAARAIAARAEETLRIVSLQDAALGSTRSVSPMLTMAPRLLRASLQQLEALLCVIEDARGDGKVEWADDES